MDRCGTWKSSYRLVLGLVQEIDAQPFFDARSLIRFHETSFTQAALDATWDVVFVRLSAVQEYGWHAGLEPLMWISDAVNGSLADLDWPRLQRELADHRESWLKLIVSHAKAHEEFFPVAEPRLRDDDEGN